MPARDAARPLLDPPALPATRAVGRVLALVAGFALQVAAVACVAAEAPAPAERWFEITIAGVPAGYVHESVDATDPDAVRTTTESTIVLNRLDARVEITERSLAVEARDGRLLRVHSEIRASKDPTVLDVEVGNGTLAIRTEAGGRHYERTEPESRPLIGPEGVRALTAARLAAGATRLSFATFAPELGGVVAVTRRVKGRAPSTDGDSAAYLVEEVMDAMPAPSEAVVGADGRIIRESVNGPFGEMKTVLATAAVRERVAYAGQLPEELYQRALVRANVRLPEPRAIERLRVRIDLKRPEGGFPALEGPYQHVVEAAADHVVLEIRRAPAVDTPPVARHGAAPFTQPNFILQSDHPDVAALARTLRRPGAGPYTQARLLQDWVAKHMRFDAGLTMVPASEVVRDRGGTCVAYAVLLTSLARALDIPARIVMGYVYVAGIWGGHAWTEVQVGGHWIPLDAAVYRAGPADAAHIALVRHSGELGAASGASELARLFGNESIRILGYRRAGAWTTVPADAVPYVVEGDRYRNAWLGLTVDKPVDFAFASADATYPDSTVIALEAPSGGEIRLKQSGPRAARGDPAEWLADSGYTVDPVERPVAGRVGRRGTRAAGAALAFRDGLDLWVLEADGEAATDRLDGVAAHLNLERAAR